MNVINMLPVTFQTMSLMEVPATREEIQLKESIQKMPQNSIFQFSEIEVWEEVSLDFPEPFKDCEIASIERQLQLG